MNEDQKPGANDPKPAKKPYQAPCVEAEEVFEVMAATCHDNRFTCQIFPTLS